MRSSRPHLVLTLVPLFVSTTTGCGDNLQPAPTGAPRDLVPFARLTASGTQHAPLFPWPREAEDAIATVRDDDPTTAWKAPVGEEAVVAIDLQPWLGRVVPLHSLSLGFQRGTPPPMKVELLDGCGGQPHATLDWREPGTELPLGDRRAGCVQVRLTAAEELWVDRLELYSKDETISVPAWDSAPVRTPYPGQANCGVVEGFYGVPWSWRERWNLVATMAEVGLGFYLYAPKNDPLHRAQWREPYPSDFVERLGRLATAADPAGITVSFGISPFIDYEAASDADYETLRAKLAVLAAAGVRGFAVLADDIELESTPVVDGALGALHAGVTNRLLADLGAAYPGVTLTFVPTVYSDERIGFWPGAPDYLRALRDLAPSIPVMWTGPLTGNETLAPADLQTFVDLVGRPPLIWDNYYANDGGDGFTGHLFLGRYAGRSADLPAAVTGIVVNPSIQGGVARVQAAMLAGYLLESRGTSLSSDVQGLYAEEAGFAGIRASYPYESRRPERQVADMFGTRKADVPTYPDLEEGVDDAVSCLTDRAAPTCASSLLGLFAGMATAQSELHVGGMEADLLDDLYFPLERARLDGEYGLATLAFLHELLAGRTGEEAQARALGAKARAATCRFVLSPGKIDELYQAVAALAPQAHRDSWEPSDDSPPRCRVGHQLEWRPFRRRYGGDADYVWGGEVVGLPHTSGIDPVQFLPPRAGTYHAVVFALDGFGWGFLEVDLHCE